ncbi:hypothetical protein Tco_0853335, partial [Tanacetum coccineum]
MAESSSHNPSSPEITPKEKPVTLDKPKSLNPFLPADQIEFSFDKIAFTTNNEVALLYHSHSNSEYFEIVYREKLVPYPRFISLLLEYIMPAYDNEELTINPTQVFSIHNWALKPNQTEGPPFIDHMKVICNIDVHVDSKAPKPSSQTKEVPQGKNLEAKMVGEMHKEAQQAAGGPTSLGATSKEGAHPQLSSGCDASVDSTAEADLGTSTPNDFIPSQQDQTKFARDGSKTAHTDSGTNKVSSADEVSKKIKL